MKKTFKTMLFFVASALFVANTAHAQEGAYAVQMHRNSTSNAPFFNAILRNQSGVEQIYLTQFAQGCEQKNGGVTVKMHSLPNKISSIVFPYKKSDGTIGYRLQIKISAYMETFPVNGIVSPDPETVSFTCNESFSPKKAFFETEQDIKQDTETFEIDKKGEKIIIVVQKEIKP